MAAVQPRAKRRVDWAVLGSVVAAAHIAAFLAASWSLPKDAPSRPATPPMTFAVLPFTPPERREPAPRPPAPVHRDKRHPRRVEAAAAPAAPGPSWTLPPAATSSQGGHAPIAGELADPYAVREALRGSVGCDMANLKLRPDEQARCDARTLRWARMGHKIAPAADDPKRAAELAAEEDYQRRKHDWVTTDCGIHNSTDELDMKGALGQLQPHRGKSKDGEDAARANAC